MGWSNFRIWRGKLPHWRADDVTYFVTFRHRRPLTDDERRELCKRLVALDQRDLDLLAVGVLPEATELLCRPRAGRDGRPVELADPIERAKTKAGKLILKQSGERWPPFYAESYDRIIRDEFEWAERWETLVQGPVREGLTEDPEDDPGLWLSPTAEPPPSPAPPDENIH